jgi:hypothetical protein
MIKLIKFDGDWIVTNVVEIPDVEFGDPDCVLKYPYQVQGECLGPWPAHSDEREIVVRSSDITVVTEPNTFLLTSYQKVIDEETV